VMNCWRTTSRSRAGEKTMMLGTLSGLRCSGHAQA
jgi:hypothetical protein